MDTGQSFTEMMASPGFLLSRVGTAVQAGFKKLLAGWKLRPLELSILLFLNAVEGASQQELCRAMGVDSGNMVEFVDELEALQYAKRTLDPADRRRRIVSITPVGRAALAEIIEAVEGYTDSFLRPLTGAERQRLTRYLDKLYASTPEGRQARIPPGAEGSAK